jgi:hypothetical protein
MCQHRPVSLPWRCAGVVLTLAWAGVARGVVDVQATARGRIDGNVVQVDLSVTNAGTDDAYAVVPEVELQSGRQQGLAVPALEGGDAHAWQLALPVPAGPGTYPLIARVRYADARGTPLSAVVVDLVCAPPCARDAVRVAFPAWTLFLQERYLVSVAVENGGAAPLAVDLHAVLPDELPGQVTQRPVVAPAGGRADVPVVIENAHAQPGGTYAAWALVEFDADGLHHAAVAQAPVVVDESGTRAADRGPAVLAALALGAVGMSGISRFVRGRPPWRRRRVDRNA